MIRSYQQSDFKAVLELIRLNTPAYFSPSEEALFEKYLQKRTNNYFVVELEGSLIGSGGIDFEEDRSASISWGMIHPDWHGKGWGTRLTQYRIERIKETDASKINVRTSQHTWKFYEKMGFSLFHTKKEYWGKGLDLYHMELKLSQYS